MIPLHTKWIMSTFDDFWSRVDMLKSAFTKPGITDTVHAARQVTICAFDEQYFSFCHQWLRSYVVACSARALMVLSFRDSVSTNERQDEMDIIM